MNDDTFRFRGQVTLDDLATVRHQTRTALEQKGLNEDACETLLLVVDEWVTNVVTHGYNDNGGELELLIENQNNGVDICIRDRGTPFDMNAQQKVDLTIAPDQPGGLGLELIRRLVDRLDYQRQDNGWNQTCFHKSI